MREERVRLDATVWADEVESQRHERSLVALWDALRTAKDKLAVLAEVPLETLAIGQAQGTEEELGLGIRRWTLSQPRVVLGRRDFQERVLTLGRHGYRVVQSEWHHARFLPARNGQPPRSEVTFVLHVAGGGPRPTEHDRFILRGTLFIRWSGQAHEGGNPIPEAIEARDVEILARSGDVPFQYSLTAEKRNEPYGSAMPVIVYDLDQDGDSDIVLSRWNRVYWNESRGEFREGPFLDRFQPHWESGIIADFTGDANADFLTVGGGNRPVLYVGAHGGTFPNEGFPCADVELDEPSAITAGDIDSDGDLDVWLSQYKLAYRNGQMPTPFYDANDGYASFLLINDGHGRFTDGTEPAGLAPKRRRRTYSCSFVDLDTDGDLDLVVVSDFAGIDIYQNDGHGSFVAQTSQLVDEHHLFGMAHTLGDYNGDGRLDMYVIGMSSTTARRLDRLGLGREDRPDIHHWRAAMTYGNRMYFAHEGRFLAPPFADHVARTGWSWGTSSLDFDNDGDRDIYVANGFRSGKSSQDYCTRYWCHDVYTGTSQPDHQIERLLSDSLRELDRGEISWNGFEHNALLMNRDGRDFVNVAFLLGVSFQYDSRSVISDDFDGDGRCDLLVGELVQERSGFSLELHLYRNHLETANHWIGVRLYESGGGCSPIGANVTLKSPRGIQVASIVTGDSFLSQHAHTVHFGLGQVQRADWIDVRWPNGQRQRLVAPEVNRYHDVRP